MRLESILAGVPAWGSLRVCSVSNVATKGEHYVFLRHLCNFLWFDLYSFPTVVRATTLFSRPRGVCVRSRRALFVPGGAF